MVEITETEPEPEQIFCLYCRNPSQDKKSCFKLKKKEAQNVHASNFNGNSDRRNYESQDVVFTATLKNKIPWMIFGFVTVERADITASQIKVY
jgi:hypothetical protein